MTISTSAVSTSFGPSLPTFSRSRIVQAVAAVALGFASFAMTSAPASAVLQRPGWETACSYKQPSGMFGNGYGIVADQCAHLRFCQSMADQGRNLAPMGCFGFEPKQRPGDKRL